jgi:hypothetical protein
MTTISRHPIPLSLALSMSLALLGAGCSKRQAEATPEPQAVVSASAAVIQTAPSGSGAPRPQANGASGPDQTLGSHLVMEAQNRKPGNPSVEDVFALCEKLGAPVPNKEQSIARTYHASYCVGGFTADRSMTINICEYPDEASVDGGVQVSQKVFMNLAARRHIFARRATTLTLFESTPSPATTAMTKKLSDAFLAM